MTIGARAWIVTSATSFFTTENRDPENVSNEVESITRSTETNSHSISCVSNLTLYRLPIDNGRSPIQTTRARQRFASMGFLVSCDPIFPRSTKIGSLSMRPTDSPAEAESFRGALHLSIEATVEVLLFGEKTIGSPTRIVPDSTLPAMILRSSKR